MEKKNMPDDSEILRDFIFSKARYIVEAYYNVKKINAHLEIHQFEYPSCAFRMQPVFEIIATLKPELKRMLTSIREIVEIAPHKETREFEGEYKLRDRVEDLESTVFMLSNSQWQKLYRLKVNTQELRRLIERLTFILKKGDSFHGETKTLKERIEVDLILFRQESEKNG